MNPLARFASVTALLLAAACSGPATEGPTTSLSTNPTERASADASTSPDGSAKTAADKAQPQRSAHALDHAGFRPTS